MLYYIIPLTLLMCVYSNICWKFGEQYFNPRVQKYTKSAQRSIKIGNGGRIAGSGLQCGLPIADSNKNLIFHNIIYSMIWTGNAS